MPLNPISTICRSVLVCSLLLIGVHAFAQFVGNNSAEVDKRVNELVGTMTLDEKIDLISGDTPFRTHPVPRYNLMLGDSSASVQQKTTLQLAKPVITSVSE